MAVAVKKKRNPQDATLRNIRALKARVLKLEIRVRRLELSMRQVAWRLQRQG